tara:strand:+ start:101 stop:505 length:405 start_codon:yes stop_codon:yes gene_type:complete
MPCKDTTSEISIILDKTDHLINFDYSKNTCGKEVGCGTGFGEFCVGKPVEILVELEFDKLIDLLDLSDSETQFLLFLEWSALSAALDQYLGRIIPKDEDRYQIATITYESDQVEIRQMVLAPSEMPKLIPCRKR